jgi:hypothetical protein
VAVIARFRYLHRVIFMGFSFRSVMFFRGTT